MTEQKLSECVVTMKPVALWTGAWTCLDRHVDTLALDTQESLLPISVVPDQLALVVCFLSLSSLFDASLSRSPHLSAHPY